LVRLREGHAKKKRWGNDGGDKQAILSVENVGCCHEKWVANRKKPSWKGKGLLGK